MPTIGLEEELILVDRDSFEPVDAIESVLAALPDERFQAEFRASQVEIVTPVFVTVAGPLRTSSRARAAQPRRGARRARAPARGRDASDLDAPVTVTDRPRYREIAADYPGSPRRGLPSGLHVHVGVGGPDEALAVYNAARSYLPELAALAANSPFFEGADSGLASSRLKLADDQPRSGIPPAFRSWRALAEFVDVGLERRPLPRLDLPLVGPAAAPGSRDARVPGRRHPDLGRAHGRDRGDLPVARGGAPLALPRRSAGCRCTRRT